MRGTFSKLVKVLVTESTFSKLLKLLPHNFVCKMFGLTQLLKALFNNLLKLKQHFLFESCCETHCSRMLWCLGQGVERFASSHLA